MASADRSLPAVAHNVKKEARPRHGVFSRYVFRTAAFPLLVKEAASHAGIELDVRGSVVHRRGVLDFLTGGEDELEIVIRADSDELDKLETDVFPKLAALGRPARITIPASDGNLVRIREGRPDEELPPVRVTHRKRFVPEGALRENPRPDWKRSWNGFGYGLLGSAGRRPFLKGFVKTKDDHFGLGLVAGDAPPPADFLVSFFGRIQEGRANHGHKQMLAGAAPKTIQTVTMEIDKAGRLELLCNGVTPVFFRGRLARHLVSPSGRSTFGARLQLATGDILLIPGFRLVRSELAELDTLCRDAENDAGLEAKLAAWLSYLGRGRAFLLRCSPDA